MINQQLQDIIHKLESKMKLEVQSRIENQRKLMTYLHDAGSTLEDNLITKFDQEISQVQERVVEIEQSLNEWEPVLLKSLTNNRQNLQQFDNETKQSLKSMSHQLQSSFKQTEHYEQLVAKRSKEFENKVYKHDLKQLEQNRDQVNLKMTQTILEFNYKVKDDMIKTEEQIKSELLAMRQQLTTEQHERKISDQILLQGFNGSVVSRMMMPIEEKVSSGEQPKINKVFNMFKKFVTNSDNVSPTDSRRTSVLMTGSLKVLKSEEEMAEIQKSYKENLKQIEMIVQQLSTNSGKEDKNSKNKGPRIKASDIPIFIAKLEEIVGLELYQLQDYINDSFYLSRTKYYYTMNDLQQAIEQWAIYNHAKLQQQYQSQTTSMQQTIVQKGLEAVTHKATLSHLSTPMKQKTFMTAYTPRNNEPKEVQKIVSLQLLVFKIATHKEKIKSYIDIQQKTASPQKQNEKEDISNETDKKANSKKGVLFDKLGEILQNVTIISGMKIASYDSYKSGLAKTQAVVQQDVVDKFMIYMYQQLRLKSYNSSYKRLTSILKKGDQNHKKNSKVVFVDDIHNIVQQDGQTFTSDDFIYYIDKFQASDNTIVCFETDGQYERHLEQQKKDEEQLHQVGNDLDDFLFSSGSDSGGKKAKAGAKNNVNKFKNSFQAQYIKDKELEKVKINKVEEETEEESQFQKQMEKTIQQYETMMNKGNFKSDTDKKETQKLLVNLKSQLSQHMQRNQKQTQSQSQNIDSKEDLQERRKRGLMEIFHFYTRQHIPQNRHFDDLKEIMNEINLGEFMIFCKDFQIPLSKAKITEIFKKQNHKSHKFEEFLTSIEKIGQEMNKDKLEETDQKLDEVAKAIKKFETVNKQKIDNKNSNKRIEFEKQDHLNSFDNYKVQRAENSSQYNSVSSQKDITPINLTKLKTDNQISVNRFDDEKASILSQKPLNMDSQLYQENDRLLKQKDLLENKTEQDITNDIMEFLECDDPSKYRKKIKGFHMAFNIREKVKFSDEEKSKYKFQTKVPVEDLKKNLEDIKNKRQLDKTVKEKDDQLKQDKDREALRKMHEQLRKDKQKGGGEMTTSDKLLNENQNKLRVKKLVQSVDSSGKITFAGIHKMHYSQLNTGHANDDFRSGDIVDEENTIELSNPYDSDNDDVLTKFKKDNIVIDNSQIVRNIQRAQQNQLNPGNANNKVLKQQSIRADNINKMISSIGTKGNSPAPDQKKILQKSLKKYSMRSSEQSLPRQNKIEDVMQTVQNSVDQINFVQQKIISAQNGVGPVNNGINNSNNKSVNYLLTNPITYREDNPSGSKGSNNRYVVNDKPPKRGGQPINQGNAISARSRKIFQEHSLDPSAIGAPYKEYQIQLAQNNSGMNQSISYPIQQNRGHSLVPTQQLYTHVSNNPRIIQSLDNSQNYVDKKGSMSHINGLSGQYQLGSIQSQKQSHSKINLYQKQAAAMVNQIDNQNDSYYSPLRASTKGDITANRSSIINRADQIALMAKKTEKKNMDGVLKMHDKQIRKGMLAANR